VQDRVDYRYIIGAVAIFLIVIYLLFILLDKDDKDNVIPAISTTKEIAKPEIKQDELVDDDWLQNSKKIDIDDKSIERKRDDTNNTTTKTEQKRFVIAHTKSDDSLFDISILSNEKPKAHMNININGVLNLDNIYSNFVLPVNILVEETRVDIFIEIKYKDRVFSGSASEIFNREYNNYSLVIDLIDDFVNIYIIENNKNQQLPSQINEQENQMILDKLNNQKIIIGKDFLNRNKEFTKVIDK
jgi:hypothetical protein